MEDSSLKKIKLTVAQAIIQYLNNQYIDVDGNENKFFSGCFGILGHGNVAGIGQAIQEQKDLLQFVILRLKLEFLSVLSGCCLLLRSLYRCEQPMCRKGNSVPDH